MSKWPSKRSDLVDKHLSECSIKSNNITNTVDAASSRSFIAGNSVQIKEKLTTVPWTTRLQFLAVHHNFWLSVHYKVELWLQIYGYLPDNCIIWLPGGFFGCPGQTDNHFFHAGRGNQ